MQRMTISIFIFFIIASYSNVFAKNSLVPLTPQCIHNASRYYNVPLSVLFAVLATERGKVGEISHNKNGTVDVGPMQINTVHFKDAERFGLTPEILTNNGCANFVFGTWYLATLLKKYDVWEAIGIYHSRTPHIKERYQKRVWQRYSELDIKELLEEINAPLYPEKPRKKKLVSVYDPVTGMIVLR